MPLELFCGCFFSRHSISLGELNTHTHGLCASAVQWQTTTTTTTKKTEINVLKFILLNYFRNSFQGYFAYEYNVYVYIIE